MIWRVKTSRLDNHCKASVEFKLNSFPQTYSLAVFSQELIILHADEEMAFQAFPSCLEHGQWTKIPEKRGTRIQANSREAWRLPGFNWFARSTGQPNYNIRIPKCRKYQIHFQTDSLKFCSHLCGRCPFYLEYSVRFGLLLFIMRRAWFKLQLHIFHEKVTRFRDFNEKYNWQLNATVWLLAGEFPSKWPYPWHFIAMLINGRGKQYFTRKGITSVWPGSPVPA